LDNLLSSLRASREAVVRGVTPLGKDQPLPARRALRPTTSRPAELGNFTRKEYPVLRKTGFYLIALAAVVIGLLVGTLNSTPVYLDLLWIQFELPLGLAVLLGFSVGLLTGLSMIYLARVLPLRLQLRKARANLSRQESPGLNSTDD
jgi:uncharacterized integral membrane protein